MRRRHWTYSDRPVSGWASLTETERRASELVAQGLTNRKVADQMFVSVHTVAFHVHTVAFHLRQVFRKLDIGSRVELTRLAVEQTPGHGAATGAACRRRACRSARAAAARSATAGESGLPKNYLV